MRRHPDREDSGYISYTYRVQVQARAASGRRRGCLIVTGIIAAGLVTGQSPPVCLGMTIH
jgi:hypothetical protein